MTASDTPGEHKRIRNLVDYVTDVEVTLAAARARIEQLEGAIATALNELHGSPLGYVMRAEKALMDVVATPARIETLLAKLGEQDILVRQGQADHRELLGMNEHMTRQRARIEELAGWADELQQQAFRYADKNAALIARIEQLEGERAKLCAVITSDQGYEDCPCRRWRFDKLTRCFEFIGAHESEPPTRDETKPPPGWRGPFDGARERWVERHSESCTLAEAWAIYDREHTRGTDSSEHTGAPVWGIGHTFMAKQMNAWNHGQNRKSGTDSSEGQPCPVTAAHGVHECVLRKGHDEDHRWDFEEATPEEPDEDGEPVKDTAQGHLSDSDASVSFSGEPDEDRNAPPLEYSVWHNGEGSVFAGVGPPEGLACDDTAEAVAACWAHRDRICASERAARDRLQAEVSKVCVEADGLRKELERAEREVLQLRVLHDAGEERGKHLEWKVTAAERTMTEERTELRERLAAAERERDELKREAEHWRPDIRYSKELRDKLAAAERRAEEAEECRRLERGARETAERAAREARSQALRDVLQELDRKRPNAEAATLREWVDRQLSLARGREES